DAYQQRLQMGRRQAGFMAPQMPPPSGINYRSDFSLSSSAARGANIGDLNTEFASRLNSWLAALPEAERATISITSAFRDAGRQAELFAQSDQSGRIVARPGGSAHNFGIGADISGMSEAAARTLSLYGLHAPLPWETGPGSAT